MVLFLFVVMLMNLNSEKKSFGRPAKILAASLISLLFVALTIGIFSQNQASANTAVEMGTGDLGTNSLYLNGTPTGNDYVYTISSAARGTIPATPTKITFWVKGTSAKSLSLNVYRSTTGYDVFNVDNLTTSAVTLNKAALNTADNGTNSYIGTIDTNGQWVKITLNISDVSINNSNTGDIFALKVGKDALYDLHIDNIEIQ